MPLSASALHAAMRASRSTRESMHGPLRLEVTKKSPKWVGAMISARVGIDARNAQIAAIKIRFIRTRSRLGEFACGRLSVIRLRRQRGAVPREAETIVRFHAGVARTASSPATPGDIPSRREF